MDKQHDENSFDKHGTAWVSWYCGQFGSDDRIGRFHTDRSGHAPPGAA